MYLKINKNYIYGCFWNAVGHLRGGRPEEHKVHLHPLERQALTPRSAEASQDTPEAFPESLPDTPKASPDTPKAF